MFFWRQKDAARPASHSACLVSFALTLACLIFFLSGSTGQAAQRSAPTGLAVLPRIDLESHDIATVKIAKAECRKSCQPVKVHAARPALNTDFLPPPAISFEEPHARSNATPLRGHTSCVRLTAAMLVARGPPV